MPLYIPEHCQHQQTKGSCFLRAQEACTLSGQQWITVSGNVSPEHRKHESAFQIHLGLNHQMLTVSSVVRAMSTFIPQAHSKDLQLSAKEQRAKEMKNSILEYN